MSTHEDFMRKKKVAETGDADKMGDVDSYSALGLTRSPSFL